MTVDLLSVTASQPSTACHSAALGLPIDLRHRQLTSQVLMLASILTSRSASSHLGPALGSELDDVQMRIL
jgi:hypothetical protein